MTDAQASRGARAARLFGRAWPQPHKPVVTSVDATKVRANDTRTATECHHSVPGGSAVHAEGLVIIGDLDCELSRGHSGRHLCHIAPSPNSAVFAWDERGYVVLVPGDTMRR